MCKAGLRQHYKARDGCIQMGKEESTYTHMCNINQEGKEVDNLRVKLLLTGNKLGFPFFYFQCGNSAMFIVIKYDEFLRTRQAPGVPPEKSLAPEEKNLNDCQVL